MIKHYLASANTGKKFVCNFEEILDHSKSEFMYIIKGGSGTGKSTLMKRVGKYFEELEFDVEYFYCSSDINSLDGIRLKKLNIAIVDGTSPHITEAKMLGVREKIIDVGKFIRPSIKNHEKLISRVIQKKKECYESIYNYLSASLLILDNNLKLLKKEVKINKLKSNRDNLIRSLNLIPQRKSVRRNFFISSLESDLVEKNNYTNIKELNYNAFENNFILKGLIEVLKRKKYNFIVFHNIINPNIIDAIEIEGDNLLVVSKPKNELRNKKLKAELHKNEEIIKNLLLLAKENLIKARENHLKMEKVYIENTDFSHFDELYTNLIKDILNRSKMFFN